MHISVLFPLYFNDKTEISGNLNRMYSILIDKRASLVSIRQIFEVIGIHLWMYLLPMHSSCLSKKAKRCQLISLN